jgi:hypothetical protein
LSAAPDVANVFNKPIKIEIMEVVKMAFWLIIIGFSIGVFLTAIWFFMAMIVNFSKIYCKNDNHYKSKCQHVNHTYRSSKEDLTWKCCDCGVIHS